MDVGQQYQASLSFIIWEIEQSGLLFFSPRFSEQIYFLSLNIICSEIEACRIPRLLAGGFRSKSVRELTLKNMIKLVGTYVTNRIRPRFSEWWKGISRSKMLSSSTFYRQVHRWVTYRNGCHARTIPPPLHLSCVMMTSWNRAGGPWRSRRHHGSQRWHKYGYCTFLPRKTIYKFILKCNAQNFQGIFFLSLKFSNILTNHII